MGAQSALALGFATQSFNFLNLSQDSSLQLPETSHQMGPIQLRGTGPGTRLVPTEEPHGRMTHHELRRGLGCVHSTIWPVRQGAEGWIRIKDGPNRATGQWSERRGFSHSDNISLEFYATDCHFVNHGSLPHAEGWTSWLMAPTSPKALRESDRLRDCSPPEFPVDIVDFHFGRDAEQLGQVVHASCRI